jgi:AraC-like DNA-binding protein
MNSAVERAISCIWERYGEPITLTDIAESAILSRFHFSRLFKDATGVSPGRFLSAIRIYHAKRLLLTTSMNVTDISFTVGFNSLGSFTNHFTDSVGISPGRFRRISRDGGIVPPVPPARPAQCDGVITGTITMPKEYIGASAYLGAFGTPIVQRSPATAVTIRIPCTGQVRYRLTNVPEGSWFVHAVAVADSADPEPWTQRAQLVGGRGAVRVTAGGVAHAAISLRPRRPTDLPILLALPDLEAELDVSTLADVAPEEAAQGVSARVS